MRREPRLWVVKGRWPWPKRLGGIALPPFGVIMRGMDAVVWKHELVHWNQAHRYGVLGFYVRYLWYTARHGYRNNPLEIEARAS